MELYIHLGGGTLLGWALGRLLPASVPNYLGKFLFWVGVPVSILAFLRRADLSGAMWIAPAAAWVAILLGATLAWLWICSQTSARQNSWSRPTQGSFLLASMVGNTGYLGYPITLALVGEQYFGWALFYDLLGTTLGAYVLGVMLAARFSTGARSWQLIQAVLKNPALWSLALGLLVRSLPLPVLVERSLNLSAWTVVAFSLVLIGMRLSHLSSWNNLRQASISLGIKMLLVPLCLGSGLRLIGITGKPLLVIVLQAAMPPAFATLVIAEAYNLNRQLAVTALAFGSIALLFTLPIWIWIF